MDFVDNVYSFFPGGREISDIFPESPNIIDPGIGGGVDFEDIER